MASFQTRDRMHYEQVKYNKCVRLPDPPAPMNHVKYLRAGPAEMICIDNVPGLKRHFGRACP